MLASASPMARWVLLVVLGAVQGTCLLRMVGNSDPPCLAVYRLFAMGWHAWLHACCISVRGRGTAMPAAASGATRHPLLCSVAEPPSILRATGQDHEL